MCADRLLRAVALVCWGGLRGGELSADRRGVSRSGRLCASHEGAAAGPRSPEACACARLEGCAPGRPDFSRCRMSWEELMAAPFGMSGSFGSFYHFESCESRAINEAHHVNCGGHPFPALSTHPHTQASAFAAMNDAVSAATWVHAAATAQGTLAFKRLRPAALDEDTTTSPGVSLPWTAAAVTDPIPAAALRSTPAQGSTTAPAPVKGTWPGPPHEFENVPPSHGTANVATRPGILVRCRRRHTAHGRSPRTR